MAKISVGLDVVHVFHKIFEEMLAVFLPDDIVKFWPSYLRFGNFSDISYASLALYFHLISIHDLHCRIITNQMT